jgi:hypothetical protein
MSLAVASAPLRSSQLAMSPAPTRTTADGSATAAGFGEVGAELDSELFLVMQETAKSKTQNRDAAGGSFIVSEV